MKIEPIPQAPPRLLAAFGIGMVAMVLWAASPAATHFMVTEIPPLVAGMGRTVFAAALALPLVLLLRLPLPKGRQQWKLTAISVGIGFILFPLVYTYGISRTSTSHAALILAALPAIVGGIGAVVERQLPGRWWFVGVVVAMAGEWLLVTTPESAGTATLAGDLICLLACFCCGAGYIAGARLSAHIGTWSATFWALVLAGVVQLPLMLYFAADVAWLSLSRSAWSGLLFMSFAVGIVGYAAWFWALREGGVVRMAPLQFTQPLISLVIAVVLLAEPITLPIAIAAVTVLAGIAITRRG